MQKNMTGAQLVLGWDRRPPSLPGQRHVGWSSPAAQPRKHVCLQKPQSRNPGLHIAAAVITPSSVQDAVKPSTVRAESNGSGPRLQQTIHLVAVVPANTRSPLSRNDVVVTWEEVLAHTATRLQFINPDFQLHVFNDTIVKDPAARKRFDESVAISQFIFANGIWGTRILDLLATHIGLPPNQLYIDSTPTMIARTTLGGVRVNLPNQQDKWLAALPWTKTRKAVDLWQTLERFYSRFESDDLLFMFLVLIDAYITPVPWVQHLRATGFQTYACMARNCGRQVLACVQDPECKAALDCLQQCAPNDQVCSYRCIVSHETPKLQDFTLCILQRNNCMGLHADIPQQPAPSPMQAWRSKPLTHEAGEEIFIGWLGNGSRYSWRVVAGQNAAYDQFSCQYQLYYRGKAKGTLWYDPVFQVRTLNGEKVWRRRHYRVRRGNAVGTFHFSVLDNGIISNEFWRILDASDDLSWALFFYAGAASAAGQAYTGAVLVTPDGNWPDSSHSDRLKAALAKASIKQWEMFQVDNSCCEDAPLDLPGANVKPDTSLRELAISGAIQG